MENTLNKDFKCICIHAQVLFVQTHTHTQYWFATKGITRQENVKRKELL